MLRSLGRSGKREYTDAQIKAHAHACAWCMCMMHVHVHVHVQCMCSACAEHVHRMCTAHL